MAIGRQDQIGELYTVGTSHDPACRWLRRENGACPARQPPLSRAIDAGPIHDDNGNLIAVVETLRDMTDQKRAEMALQTLAARTALTGLANRRSFDQALELEWQRAMRSGKPVALLFADVDHFKRFNDCHGHQGGDECLRVVAAAIAPTEARSGRPILPPAMAARSSPSSCRTPTWPRRERPDRDACVSAVAGSEDHTRQFQRRAVCDDEHWRRHLHAGQDVIGPDWLLGQADQALYAAKHLGRNRVVSTDTMLMELARAHSTRLQAGKAQPATEAPAQKNTSRAAKR